jgi:hypothetical protein
MLHCFPSESQWMLCPDGRWMLLSPAATDADVLLCYINKNFIHLIKQDKTSASSAKGGKASQHRETAAGGRASITAS